MGALVNPYAFANNFGPPGTAIDPLFSSVVFMMNMAGTNGLADAIDHSNSAHSLTYNGGLVLGTSPTLHQSTSLTFDGSNDDISSADNLDWTPGAGAYTFEARIRTPATITDEIIISHYNASVSQRSWILDLRATGGNLRLVLSGNGLSTAGNIMTVQGGTLSASTDYEIAADITDDGDIKIYIDGAVVATGNRSDLNADSVHNSTGTFRIGTTDDLVQRFSGTMYELRLTKGVARYQGAYNVINATYPTK